MATFLEITSGFFCLRPITWGIEQLISRKRVRAIALEIFYLVLSLWYSFCWFAVIPYLSFKIEYLLLYFYGMFGLIAMNYGIYHYHKRSDVDMDEIVHTGYTVSGSINTETGDLEDASVSDRYENRLTGTGKFTVMLAPFLSIVRFVNLIRVFVLYRNLDYRCDLVEHRHPESDSDLFAIINDFTEVHADQSKVPANVQNALQTIAVFASIAIWIYLVYLTLSRF